MTARTPTAKQRARRDALDALAARLKAAVEDTTEDDQEDLAGRFEGRYSWRNVLLILDQRPDATVVRGYDQWKAEGRQVVRGQTAIRIRKVVGGGDTAEGAETTGGWKACIWLSVFDIDQTAPVEVEPDPV